MQKAGEMELKFLWERYVAVNARCSEIEGQRQAKIESKVCSGNVHFGFSFNHSI